MKWKVYILMKYTHSKKFFDDRYKKYKRDVKAIGGTILKKNAFKGAYLGQVEAGSKNPMRDLVYASKYSTSYGTALAEYRALKGAGIKGVKLEELKLLTTQDFAYTYSTELSKAYSELKKAGITGRDASAIISAQWFGSK